MMNFDRRLVSGNIRNFLPDISPETVREEIIRGLRSPRKYILSKYFYDEKGSGLFKAITGLGEYYPTRTEKTILQDNLTSIANGCPFRYIIELGSGDSSKISLLLRSFSRMRLKKIKYIPVDISRPAIEESILCLLESFYEIKIEGMVADFMTQLHNIPDDESPRLFCFFGSTVGNFEPARRSEFLEKIGKIMRKGDMLLMGADMVKDVAVLEKAYNDKKGITADFNKNILNSVNTILQSNFDIRKFKHIAFYNQEYARIEMHLEAMENMSILSSFLGEPVILEKGETIHTENSYKFREDDFVDMCRDSGLSLERIYSDNNNWFSVLHFVKNT